MWRYIYLQIRIVPSIVCLVLPADVLDWLAEPGFKATWAPQNVQLPPEAAWPAAQKPKKSHCCASYSMGFLIGWELGLHWTGWSSPREEISAIESVQSHRKAIVRDRLKGIDMGNFQHEAVNQLHFHSLPGAVQACHVKSSLWRA